MKFHQKLMMSLSILLVGNSCGTVYYPNYPVIAEVKDKALGAQVTIGTTKAQVSGWYAFDSSFFTTATLSGAYDWYEYFRIYDSKSKTITGSAGFGYQFKFGTEGVSQILGGAGISSGHFNTNLFNSASNGNIYHAVGFNYQSARFYLQPSIGIQNLKGGTYFITRFTMERFTNLKQTSGVFIDDLKKRSFKFIEPMILLRFFGDAINVDCYFGASTCIENWKNMNNMSFDFSVGQPFTFGIGLSRNF